MWDSEIRFVYSWGKVEKETKTKICSGGGSGRHVRLKIECQKRTGSSPVPSTKACPLSSVD